MKQDYQEPKTYSTKDVIKKSRKDKSVKIAWFVAFAYLCYSLVGDIPGISNYPLFSTQVLSLVFIMLYLYHSYSTLGVKTATKFLLTTTVLGYSFEFLFITTGWIGKYTYTSALAPFLGPVPFFIPLLWAALSYFCMLAVDSYVVSAMLMVSLDLAFDPRFSLTLWHWESPGQYFGVPITNFIGWFITSLTIYGVFYLVSRRKASSSKISISFFLLLAITIGAIPDVVAGLSAAALIAGILYCVAAVLIFTNFKRLSSKKGRRVSGDLSVAAAPQSNMRTKSAAG